MARLPVRSRVWSRTAAAIAIAVAVVTGCTSSSTPETANEPVAPERESRPVTPERESRPVTPEPNLTVAFLGDQGLSQEAGAVLNLVKEEAADLVIHTGDLDYADDPAAWDAAVTEVLGPDFPYFIAMGNHEERASPGMGGEPAWDGPDGYQQIGWDRVAGIPGVECEGGYGVRSVCTYRGLWFLLSAVGLDGGTPESHAEYIEEQCTAAPHLWKIANWHLNQTAMQVGDQRDHVGWGVYEAARTCGAIVSTSHEHSYARTRTLTSTVQQTVDSTCARASALCVGPGRTFVFHAGLGGRSIRDQERCLPTRYPYGCEGEWARIYTASQDATYGALFITFHVDGDPGKARGYFKNIDGQVVDRFTVTAVAHGTGEQ